MSIPVAPLPCPYMHCMPRVLAAALTAPSAERRASLADLCCLTLQMPQLEVWFQRASDVVRKLSYGDVDLGIVGFDMFSELSNDDPDLLVVHDALDFGHCHLGLGVPMGGR